MTEMQPEGEGRRIAPKDVFDRSNMPSRWERLTNVSPKIPEDKRFLAFVAARYSGEKRLPHPDALVIPNEVLRSQRANTVGGWACAATVAIVITGLAAHNFVLASVGAVALVVAFATMVAVTGAAAPTVSEFRALKSRCETAQARLSGDSLDPEYRSTLNKMINCDEGTLAYCAAKIASEIERDPGWKPASSHLLTIDLCDELAEIGESARQIAQDREATELLEYGRLSDDPEVRQTIDADKKMRKEAIALLAARVGALADYRDRVHRLGANALRASRTASRARTLAADEMSISRLR